MCHKPKRMTILLCWIQESCGKKKLQFQLVIILFFCSFYLVQLTNVFSILVFVILLVLVNYNNLGPELVLARPHSRIVASHLNSKRWVKYYILSCIFHASFAQENKSSVYKSKVLGARSHSTFILPMRADSANEFQWEWSGLLPFADFCKKTKQNKPVPFPLKCIYRSRPHRQNKSVAWPCT